MAKKEKEISAEFYNYWLSTHDFLKERTEPKIPGWVLDINFTNINRKSGRFNNQETNILFHGTINKIKDSLESKGLRAKEGSACFTRRLSHALNMYAVMGGYTMIGNRSIDKFIQKIVEKEIIKGKNLKEQAKNAFEYWCKDKQRENLGLITIWDPPINLISLDKKKNS